MTDFDWLQLARKHASSDPPTPGEQAALENALSAVDNDPARPNPTTTQHTQHAWACLMLATTPDTWNALLTGQPVHPNALDPYWLGELRKRGLWTN